MRISDLDVVVDQPGPIALLNLRLLTAEGLTGQSQTTLPHRPAALLATLDSFRSSPLIGADATQPARILQLLNRLEPVQQSPASATAVGLVETACWDLAARHAGVPLHRLLGGAVRDEVVACASGWEPADRSAESLCEAARQVVAQGYRVVKFAPFTQSTVAAHLTRADKFRAIRSCEVIRAALGPDVSLWLTFNGLFSAPEALRLATAVKRIEPAGILDPLCPDSAHQLISLARRVGLPLAISERAHQWSLRRPEFVEGALCLVATEPTVAGGVIATRNLATLAFAHGIGFALKTSGGPVALAHAVELGFTLPAVSFIEAPFHPPCPGDAFVLHPLTAGMFLSGNIPEPSHIVMRPSV